VPWAEIIDGITGQGGAIVVCVVVMFGCYKIMVDHILPAHERTIDKISSGCEDRTKAMLASHEEDRKVFNKAFENVDRRLIVIEEVVADVKSKMCM
jgi:hypothetical protein